MERFELSHQKISAKRRHDGIGLFLPDRENPVAFFVYQIIDEQKILIGSFGTVNGIAPKDNTIISREEVKMLGWNEFGKGLYPGLGTECLRYFVRNIAGVNSGIQSIELTSAPSSVSFYRKVAKRLLDSGDIASWKQGDGSELTAKLPLFLIKYLFLDYLRQFANPTKFTFQLQK